MTCDPLTGYCMDEATASFFYGPGGMQHVQQLFGPCQQPTCNRLTPGVLPPRTKDKMPRLSKLIRQSELTYTPTYTAPLASPAAAVGVLAGGARIADAVEQAENELALSVPVMQTEEAQEVSNNLSLVLGALETITWNWSSLRENGIIHDDATLSLLQRYKTKNPQKHAQMQEMHLLSSTVLQLVQLYHTRVIERQEVVAPAYKQAFEQSYDTLQTFLTTTLYDWWHMFYKDISRMSKTKAIEYQRFYTAEVSKRTDAVMAQRSDVLAAAQTMSRVLANNNAWKPPATMFQRACTMVMGKFKKVALCFLPIVIKLFVHELGSSPDFEAFVLAYVNRTPTELVGEAGAWLQQNVPWVYNRIMHIIYPPRYAPRYDNEMNLEIVMQYRYLKLLIYLSSYLQEQMQLPLEYSAVAFLFLFMTLSYVLPAVTRWSVNKLMNVANMTRAVASMDRYLWRFGIMHVSNFRYVCDNNECKLINTYLFHLDVPKYKTKEECLAACT